ncbi:hypothetical protein PVA8_233 [Vibrio phage PVA8]|nr:hypothetical protein [Vibrio phage PC-Liy1]URQ03219.1 hypothetical protein PVA8_233 [Vibrio phage PVA8]WBM58954.1 hypothetical protein vBValMPVA8_232 [Vibrio phage vB_ValM_PVA8]
MNFQTFMYKWKRFSFDFNNYAVEKQRGLVGVVDFVMKKHFTHRVYDRFCPAEFSILRRMLYHTVNKHLGEVLFWYYSTDKRELAIKRDDIFIIMQRGVTGCILITTVYRNEHKQNSDKFFLIDISRKQNEAD